MRKLATTGIGILGFTCGYLTLMVCNRTSQTFAKKEPDDPEAYLPGPVPTVALSYLPKSTLSETAFHRKHERLIAQHMQLLVKAGRVSTTVFNPEMYLGTYGWYSGMCDEYSDPTTSGPCSFGAYTFSQAAFEQAKRLYILHGQIEGGSDLLIDVGSGAFDKEVVGYSVPYLSYCELTGGKLKHCDSGAEDNFTDAKVVEFIDKHTVRLNKKAKWNAEMDELVIRPPDYVDMCNCTVPSTSASSTGIGAIKP